MATYTDQERSTIRTAALGAVYLVSKAEPGALDMIKESFAGSKAFAKASPQLQDLMKGGGMPQIPKGSASEIESDILDKLSESTSILQSKGQQELDSFRDAVANAVDEAAKAGGGGESPSETDAIMKVRGAIGLN